MEIKLPKQFPDVTTFESIKEAGDAVTVVSQAAMGANIVLTIFFSVSLKAMWNMVHVIQVIIFLAETVLFPSNTQLFIVSFKEAIELNSFVNQFNKRVLQSSVL